MSTHPHPISLVQKTWILPLVAAAILAWVLFHPEVVVHAFHLSAQSPGIWLIEAIYGQWRPAILVVAALVPLFAFIGVYGWWTLTIYQITERYLEMRQGPFASKSIRLPVQGADILPRSWLGMLFGFGDIHFVNGGEHEYMRYVPNVEAYRDAILEFGSSLPWVWSR